MRIYRMDSSLSLLPDPLPPANRGRSLGILATVAVLAVSMGYVVSAFPRDDMRSADKSAVSLGYAVQICLDMQQTPAQPS